ncbi:putative Pre-mRNA-splicing factor prp1 [Aulographum hederae CBS 113979]|uniref:Putative Pre-mRNA-splicing factor prp1 n=1 Tax=Aulographum hederae CBS 113979 TaxID=1176131 RepID=A0A6G1GXT7_9PEZI|nr:putative Pre-mRNA-splicing factor prp1 [Aulographum hederae CBS 113979]
MSGRKDFLSQQAPENYVAGLGRGATGFVTRSDLGPSREGPSDDQIKEALAKRAAQLGSAAPTAYGIPEKKEDDDDEERYQDPDSEVGLFAHGAYDREDDEADRIYQSVDDRMEKRRKKSRQDREKREEDEYNRKNPKIQQQFADLKRNLANVTDEEWESIPEVGDLTGKNRRTKANLRKRFYAVPDSVIAGVASQGQMDTSISAADGPEGDGAATSLAEFGAAREKQLVARLDQAGTSSSVSGGSGTATSVDVKGYMTSLDADFNPSSMNVGDIKRARDLLESVIKTNPKHAPGWLAAARLEEYAGKTVAARNVIARACETCPKSEDLWLENIRLNERANGKIIAARGLKLNDKSIRLWTAAMNLESEPRAKKKVLRLALDAVPESVTLWKEAVNLEESEEDAKLMLSKAVEVIPLSVELWLALARLEEKDVAMRIINKARATIPTSYEIYVAGARLQEQSGSIALVGKIMKTCAETMARLGVMLKREDWIAEAERCEEDGSNETAMAIVKYTLAHGIEDSDERLSIWKEDARGSIARGKLWTARAIYLLAASHFPENESIWIDLINLERKRGSQELIMEALRDGINAVPYSKSLWIMLAKEKWNSGDQEGARKQLALAFHQLQGHSEEEVYFAGVEMEMQINNITAARTHLKAAREQVDTDRVYIKSVAFERQQGNTDEALALVNEGLSKFPGAGKLWMQKGQIYEGLDKMANAREAYNAGTRASPKSVPLWILLSRLDERSGAVVKARSVLDRGRIAVPKNEMLWVESVRLERRVGNLTASANLMAQAQKACPHSGVLLAERIFHLETRTQRRPLVFDAMKNSKGAASPLLLATAARIFWAERKLDSATRWFENALSTDPDNGDIWAWYYKFLLEYGTEEKKTETLKMIAATNPKHGELWASVKKDPKNVGFTPGQVLEKVIPMLGQAA